MSAENPGHEDRGESSQVITRQMLIKWAAEHLRRGRALREEAARLIAAAEAIERRADKCTRDAEEMDR
jgi:hypothetical protein